MRPSKYVNHSGGAEGSDKAWDEIGRSFGVTDHRHYRPYDYDNAPSDVRARIDEDVEKAAKALGRPSIFKGFKLVKRNWFQVENSDAIFAIGYQVPPGGRDSRGFVNEAFKTVVAGGTGWAVEMAIQKAKPVYLFDLKHKKWFKWNYHIDDFDRVDINPPKLTQHFAGIGTREITSAGLTAITNVYIATFYPITDDTWESRRWNEELTDYVDMSGYG